MKKKESELELSKIAKEQIAFSIQNYLYSEFDVEISGLQATLFESFITEKLGSYYYNQGVTDSMRVMKEKTDDLFLIMKDER